MHSSDLASTLSPCSSVGAMGDIKITAMDIKITAMKIMSPMKIIGDIKITAISFLSLCTFAGGPPKTLCAPA